MAVERISGGTSLIDLIDRVLDKGIVVDAWVRVSLVGIDLATRGARVVVTSVHTCLTYVDVVANSAYVTSSPGQYEAEYDDAATSDGAVLRARLAATGGGLAKSTAHLRTRRVGRRRPARA